MVTTTNAGAKDPGQAATERFAAELKRAYMFAGAPAYRELAERVGSSPSTLSRVFSGKQLPSWKLVRRILNECRIGDTRPWGVKWADAKNAVNAAKTAQRAATAAGQATASLIDPPPPPGGGECGECGAWVTNTAAHVLWHRSLSGQGRSPTLRAVPNPPADR